MSFQLAKDKLPRCCHPEQAEVGFANWQERAAREPDPKLSEFMKDLAADPLGHALLTGIFANSRFLSHCVVTEVETFAAFFERGPDPVLSDVAAQLKNEVSSETDRATLATALRVRRRRASLIIALVDITDVSLGIEVLFPAPDASGGT